MLMGTSFNASSRFSAVTTMVASELASLSAGFAASSATLFSQTKGPMAPNNASGASLMVLLIGFSLVVPCIQPGGGQQAAEIAAEDGLDIGVAVAAADQGLGEIENLARMIEAVGVDPVPDSGAGFVAGLELFILIGRHLVVAVEVRVRADADMLDADELHHMVDVVDDVLHGGGFPVLDEVAHAGDSHDTALARESLDRFIGLETRMIVEGAAVRMGEGDGFGR